MVSDAHRLLAGRTPGGAGAHRIWVVHGPAVQDIFFHDTYHGCVTIQRSLALWAIHDWAHNDDADPPLVVLLNRDGELDFGYNDDAEAAEARFHQMRRPRPPRYGHRRSRSAAGDESPAVDDAARERQQAAEQAESQTRASVGGRGLIHRMTMITRVFEHARPARILVMIEELPYQLGQLGNQGHAVERSEALRIISVEWTEKIDQTHAMVVIVEPSDGELREALGFDQNRVNWEWTKVGTPAPSEITEALLRSARRLGFVYRQPEAVGEFLESRGFLREAVGVAARVVGKGNDVTPTTVRDLPPVDEAEVARVLAELDAMVGLAEVKRKAKDVVASARVRRDNLEKKGTFPDEYMHMIFSGAAGTGKTTVARLFARLFHALGLLPHGNLVEATTSEGLFDPAMGRTGQNMQALIERSLGGVLFIDEAHTLGKRQRDRGESPAMEAVRALVPMASNHRNNLVIILAMYANAVADVLAMDEGLPRRFPLYGRFEFADYTQAELWEILLRKLASDGWAVASSAEAGLQAMLRRRSALPGFGNAGGVDTLVQEVVQFHDAREGSRPGVLEPEDLPPAVVQRPEHIRQAQEKLDALVGLGSVRAMLDGVVGELVYDAQEGEANGLQMPGMLFVGPPGTGKTTVAKLLAQWLYGLGVLDNDRFVDVTGAGLKAPFVGQSAELVRETVARARGGVLLIDEAYGIVDGDHDEFGKQAQAELLVQVLAPENVSTVFILAGYEAQVAEMVKRNPGMARRFPQRVVFENLTPDECAEVARRLLVLGKRTWQEGLLDAFRSRARRAMAVQGPVFGNAGWAESEVKTAVGRMKKRVAAAQLPTSDPGRRMVLLEDLEPQQDLARRANLLQQAEAELDTLVGLDSVRTLLRDLVTTITYNLEEGQGGQVRLDGLLFVGPPGTGKTTVAQLMAKLLHGHGVLDNDRCTTVTGPELKADFEGQTAGKVQRIVSEARGGVLLIDEAYGIISGPQDQFGREAQVQLLKEVLSPMNDSTVFILAGYEADIDRMIRTNQGMQGRFPNTVRFDRLSPHDCAEVATRKLTTGGYTWQEGFPEAFARLARSAIAAQREEFGNARWTSTAISKALTQMMVRVTRERVPVGDPRRREVTVADLEESAGMSLSDPGSEGDGDQGGDPVMPTEAPRSLLADADWHADPADPPMATYDDALHDQRTALARLHESSVHIVVDLMDGRRGAASGFVVTHDGLVVTNAHVVRDARGIAVLIGPERTPLPGRVVRIAGDEVDLALVAVQLSDDAQMRPLPLGISAGLGQLDDLLVVGNAAVEPGEQPRVVRAEVSRNDPEQNPIHFEADGGIEEGFSGGPVVCCDSGSAVGVVVGGLGNTVKVIIRSEQVRLLLAKLGYTFQEA